MTKLDLIPNSPEWLAELAKLNPLQAETTRALIQAAGSEEICQVNADLFDFGVDPPIVLDPDGQNIEAVFHGPA